MAITLTEAIAEFGRAACAKLSSATAKGEPEDQLRAPFEQLLKDMATLAGHAAGKVVAVGESSIAELHTRPDYAVTVNGALVGFIELKAPGKGADPRKFKGHDKAQWQRLQCLPNLIYTDGNAFSLWRDGELASPIEQLKGDVATSGDALAAEPGLLALFEFFLGWHPIAPSTAKELAEVSARLCRLLREEVTEALGRRDPALTDLANDWRHLLFPNADDAQFADGYAQAVTFGMLMARARAIPITADLHAVSVELRKTSSLIGTALQLLTDNDATRAALKTSLGTLERVLNAVSWAKISRGRSDAWLYFYEDFLELYDNDLRKATGSYYTPPEVVAGMVALVDEALRRPGFALVRGLAAPEVMVADPATGTGTFMLGVLRHIAAAVALDEGPGAVAAAVQAALARLIGFELQLGPFAVAQLRLIAEVLSHTGTLPAQPPRMFVTDTLGNPDDDGGQFPSFLAAIGNQRKAANQVKREQPITVVIGNPPYKEKAKGRGGWVEGEGRKKGEYAPLADWQPPKEWQVGTHAKHLRNLYVYFWRWATYKVFDHRPAVGSQAGQGGAGIVAFITVAGYLSGPGFQRMREYLRQRCQDIWVIDCSPEGHQPEVGTRLFQGVQQPVCIVIASRWRDNATADEIAGEDAAVPARPKLAEVHFRALPAGHRRDKFVALAALRLDDGGWQDCPTDPRAPFLPAAVGAWATFPALEDFFVYNGSGVMPGRTWVIAPDAESLKQRWQRLVNAPAADKEALFHPHLRGGKPGDKHSKKVVPGALAGFPPRSVSVADDAGECLPPQRYAFRSFDRQWLIPDVRLINQPNPQLWTAQSDLQVSLTVPHDRSPSYGPSLTLVADVPDLHHYNGRGGRVFPLWADAAATVPNLHPSLLTHLSACYGQPVTADALFAYLVAVAAHPGYLARFAADLSSPGLRIPLTADVALFAEAVALGRRVVWLHSFGERMADASAERPAGPPRLPPGQRPQVPVGGAIPSDAAGFPDLIEYDATAQRLRVGTGCVEPVPPAVWAYEVSGKQVLTQWFSYRRKTRERPMIGDRRKPSPLGDIQPDTWPAEYTTELLNVLNVLGLLVALEPQADDLLARLCAGPLIDEASLRAAGALPAPGAASTRARPAVPDVGGANLDLFASDHAVEAGEPS